MYLFCLSTHRETSEKDFVKYLLLLVFRPVKDQKENIVLVLFGSVISAIFSFLDGKVLFRYHHPSKDKELIAFSQIFNYVITYYAYVLAVIPTVEIVE